MLLLLFNGIRNNNSLLVLPKPCNETIILLFVKISLILFSFAKIESRKFILLKTPFHSATSSNSFFIKFFLLILLISFEKLFVSNSYSN